MATVEAADGRVWQVRRRWFGPRAARVVDGYHRGWTRVLEVIGGTSRQVNELVEPLPPSGMAMASFQQPNPMGGAGCLLLPVYAVVGVALGAIDGLLRLTFGAVALVGHVVLRRPWTVEAQGLLAEPIVERVVGWRASASARDQLAASLRTGRSPGIGRGPVEG